MQKYKVLDICIRSVDMGTILLPMVETPTNYIYLDSAQWSLQNGTHIDYQYSFDKNGRKAVKFI